MTAHFLSPVSEDLRNFLIFKRSVGYRYARAEFTLLEFDRFLNKYAVENRRWRLDQAIMAWLSSKPQRQPISVGADATVLRQFCSYLHRLPGRRAGRDPLWPKLPTESVFVPCVLSEANIHQLLELATHLGRPNFRASLYRALLLVLYCTGLRFGEALRLCLRDVNTGTGLIFVDMFKGRSRWVPMHRSLSRELDKYLVERRTVARAQPDDRFFTGANCKELPVSTAEYTLRKLFQRAGLKPARGRVGPRPYDLRHAFAVQRLSLWYRRGMDLHAHLPWLSAYMGHDDILGTETYLTATPELLELAGSRLRRRYMETSEQEDVDI
jgi:site-specific recombinase XerD